MIGNEGNSYRSNVEICSGQTWSYLDGTTKVPLNEWTHLTVTWNGQVKENVLKSYFNGSFESQGGATFDSLRSNFSGNL